MKSINSQKVSQRCAGYNSEPITIPRLTGELNKERTVDIRQITLYKLEQSSCQLYTNLTRLFGWLEIKDFYCNQRIDSKSASPALEKIVFFN